MAQDFQDLTGQVIKKMMDVVMQLEKQLIQVLIDNTPADKRQEPVQVVSDVSKKTAAINSDDLLNGPQYKTVTSADAVSDQGQVDDLLASLGF